ncbi:phosphoribosylaminoimidazolesuccinocarboxamide synthase [Oscillatoria sp. CS-180]|uniref:phosphoribosylaminoimidazolesuccinocarboxamide synthase n=1 Tax=Oscillatoria sp. CS-180 TaxID=3021720 RepID=UPI00232B646D|nr:phosphoribosylaminoimidazolesuccinocarboxamide synthase [Oscillatoria sp. CS-180]MDB9528565.1 phosphoribosylaminoimidazolesuccinocarboxamide synthase [Oscillatoria sp. CS-180]
MERQQVYEGKAKVLYSTEDPGVLVSYFKDDATAFNAQKKGQIADKGKLNCTIATHLFRLLESQGISTHWIETISDREMQVRRVDIIPLEVVVRNVAAGSLCKQTGIALGTPLKPSLVEFYYKNDELGDPLLTRDRIRALQLADEAQIKDLIRLANQINTALRIFFEKCQIILVDFKLEFGLDDQGSIILADEISPDTCRLWDRVETDASARILDKDRFRKDLGQVAEAYQEVLQRILAQISLK